MIRSCLTGALRGMRAAPLIQLAATGTIAVGLLLVGLAVLGARNLESLTSHWGRGVQIVAYLRPEAPPAKTRALEAVLRSRAEVLSVRHVDPSEAHRRLAESLGSRRGLLDGVESGFLPASLEIALSPDRDGRPLIAMLSASPLCEEVDDLGSWVKRLGAFATVLRLGGLLLALIVAGACLYIVGSTIRLGVFARREEIEILKLVGATDRFVRAPFLLEGALQGICGSALALLLLFTAHRLAAPRIETALSVALSHLRIDFLPLSQVALGLGAGALLGLVGSRIALGRYLDV
jgi:cell division transport system permease protein